MGTINHETYVSLETAKLLKRAGFDWECQYYIHAYTQEIIDSIKTHKKSYRNEDVDFSAPTFDMAQRWLREVKGIEVNTLCVYINNAKKYSYCVFKGKYNNEHIEEGFDTFEEAQEAGIKKALELILEKK